MTPARSEDGMERRVGTLEVNVATILTTLKTHSEWVGESRAFHKDMSEFKTSLLAAQQATRQEQSERHRSNATKLNVITALIAFGTLLILTATLIVSVWVSKHAQFTPQQLLHSQQSEPQTAQSAEMPSTYITR